MGRDKLPERSTRGRRMQQAVEDEDDQADTAFWNQEFFQEEAVDNDYKTESEPEDEVDTDFDEEEDADDDDDVEVRDEPRKKALKPPGYKAKPKPKPKSTPKQKAEDDESAEEEEVDDEEEGDDGEGKPSKVPREPVVYVAPTLRRSTVSKVAEAQRERQYKEKSTRRRAPGSGGSSWRPLTQQELLAEAALNEIENTRSLKALLAQEEESKRKAQVVKKKNTGVSIKFRSRKGPEGEERTTLELVNTLHPPRWMQPSRAPSPPGKPTCAITGLPARYIDPPTHTPFANTLAYKRLRTGAGPLAPTLQQQLVLHHHMEEMQRQQQDRQQGQPLLQQLLAQKRRREQLVERAQSLADNSRVDPRVPEPLPQGATVDVMALVVDVHRSLMAVA